MAATKTTTLHDLTMNFEKYMFGCCIVPVNPIAKGFTVFSPCIPYGKTNSKIVYWYILDVREDGTYPCVTIDGEQRVFDQNSKVVIHHIDNK